MDNALPAGKLNPGLLERCLALCPTEAPDVLLGPALGEDAAVVSSPPGCVVLKSDPITFATDRLGWYAVHVPANDVATRGVDPRWMLLTLLLPVGATEADTLSVFDQVGRACRQLGVVLVGGHTEVTAAVVQPVASTSLVAPAGATALIRTSGLMPGDAIIMSGQYPIEGAAVLAAELPSRLLDLGVPQADIDTAAAYLDDPGISVLPAARAVRGVEGIHSMHDPTEGGMACGLWEMAQAAGVTIEVDASAMPLSREGGVICRALGIDPLGTLASGALLIGCSGSSADECIASLKAHGVVGVNIGHVLEGPGRVLQKGTGTELPWSVTDEVTRLFT